MQWRKDLAATSRRPPLADSIYYIMNNNIILNKENLAHLVKGTQSFPYFLKNVVYFQGPGGPLSPDKWEEPQLKIAQSLQDNPETIVLKSRQCGMSWILAAYTLWKAAFRPHSRVIILSTTETAAKKLKQRINFIYDNMPTYMKSTIGANNVESMEFKDIASYISCVSSAPTSSRGETVSLVILDEFAFMEKADLIWSAVRFTATHGGQIIISSTPNGVGNEFHRIWADANNGLNSFVPLKLHYSELSFYTEEMIAKLKQGSNSDAWNQEMECSFLLSGRPVFSIIDVEEICKHPLKIPVEGEVFAGGIDPSDGAIDFTGIMVLSQQWREVYSEVHRKPLVEGIEYAKRLLEKYPGIWIIEKNNHGSAYIAELQKHFQFNPRVSIIPFTTSNKTKGGLFNRLTIAVEKQELMLNSKIVKNEMMTMQYVNSQDSNATHIKAFTGYHDDMVMALALALRATGYIGHQEPISGYDYGIRQLAPADPWAKRSLYG